MPTVMISLSDSLNDFAEAQAAAKGHRTIEDYLQSLLQAEKAQQDARLEALLLEGLASGDAMPLGESFWQDLRAEAERAVRGDQPAPTPL
jgi:antitoxin ParD1/3/4